MTAHLHVEALVVVDGEIIESVDNEQASWERTIVLMKDPYKEILGDANARVSVSVSERIGAEHYSSCSMNVTVTLNCDQNTETIAKAQKMALNEAVDFIDTHVLKVRSLLDAHLEKLYPEEA